MKQLLSSKTELANDDTDNLKTAQVYFSQGNDKINFKDYHGAIADYTISLEIDPKHTMAYYYRGCAKMFIQDSKGAIADFNKAISIPLIAKNGFFGDSASNIQ